MKPEKADVEGMSMRADLQARFSVALGRLNEALSNRDREKGVFDGVMALHPDVAEAYRRLQEAEARCKTLGAELAKVVDGRV